MGKRILGISITSYSHKLQKKHRLHTASVSVTTKTISKEDSPTHTTVSESKILEGLRKDVKAIHALLVSPIRAEDSNLEDQLSLLIKKLRSKRLAALTFVLKDISSKTEFSIQVNSVMTKVKCAEQLVAWVSVRSPICLCLLTHDLSAGHNL